MRKDLSFDGEMDRSRIDFSSTYCHLRELFILKSGRRIVYFAISCHVSCNHDLNISKMWSSLTNSQTNIFCFQFISQMEITDRIHFHMDVSICDGILFNCLWWCHNVHLFGV